jgi:hypothetical protein
MALASSVRAPHLLLIAHSMILSVSLWLHIHISKTVTAVPERWDVRWGTYSVVTKKTTYRLSVKVDPNVKTTGNTDKRPNHLNTHKRMVSNFLSQWTLTWPELGGPLNETDTDKIHQYHVKYKNRPSNSISCSLLWLVRQDVYIVNLCSFQIVFFVDSSGNWPIFYRFRRSTYSIQPWPVPLPTHGVLLTTQV